MSKYEKMVDKIRQIIGEEEPKHTEGSGTRYMGYRPSEERIRMFIKEIIGEYEIIKLELNINRDCISYWYRSSASTEAEE